MRTYGTLTWTPDGDSVAGRPTWVLDVHPHVAIKVKRLFPRIQEYRTNEILIADTPELAAELEWFTIRYPLEMTDRTRTRLSAQARDHEDYITAIDNVLAGQHQFDEFPPPARAPRPYQQTAADLAYLTGGLLLGDEVGLGKTQSALMMLRDPSTLPALIVVPTHLPKQWLRELNAVLPHLKGHIVTKGSPLVRRQRRGQTVEVPYDTQGADVLIMSYSKLAGWRHSLAGQIKTVIFDEVQELRRAGSEKYSAAAAIADGGDRRMGLSATPVYNYGGEVFNIYEILKPGVLGTREEFFCEWGSFQRTTGDIVVSDPAALGEFLRDQGLLLRRTRAEVGRELLDPAEVVMDIDSATDATDAAMADVVQMAHLVLSGTRQERFTAAGQIDMKLRQATGIDKAPYVAAFARLLLESETKIVIFGWHRAVYDIWLRELSEFQPVMFTGTETAAQKQASVDRFTTDPNCRIFLCSLRSGAGLDGLQGVASVCIFGELDWSPAMHHQAIGRLARDGQEGEVVAYYPVSNIGSDPIISGVLEDKRQQAEPFMAGDEGALFTAQTDDTGRIKRLAQAVLDKSYTKPSPRRRAS
ncbi:DEAD/DEAH box helicase [Gordonia sihwensis]|uniref:SNF2-related protein n=1 Tax=Gordonia sihwensis TaxID=173559 RepID=UPI0005EFE7E7|nr:DEAD/DEAH box helicase [Gordonia sihwensis]KJR10261.1 hypothetical protein UG54_01390 [Gordonia sihwensis]